MFSTYPIAFYVEEIAVQVKKPSTLLAPIRNKELAVRALECPVEPSIPGLLLFSWRLRFLDDGLTELVSVLLNPW